MVSQMITDQAYEALWNFLANHFGSVKILVLPFREMYTPQKLARPSTTRFQDRRYGREETDATTS